MRKRAMVMGGGPSGWSAAMLLRQRGWQVDMVTHPPAHGPVVLLNDSCIHLLRDVWGDVFEWSLMGAHFVHQRLVAWQGPHEFSQWPHAAWAMPVANLASAMSDRAVAAGVRWLQPGQGSRDEYDWVIEATGRPKRPSPAMMAFGNRRALSAPVSLRGRAPTDRCMLEAVSGGWVFLIPQGPGRGTLQAMSALPVADPAACLRGLWQQTRHIAEEIETPPSQIACYPAMPALRRDSASAGHLAIGDAAMAYDPISGDGIGAGLRCALLACAVMETAQAHDGAMDGLRHYAQRLRLAATVHVQRCITLYRGAADARRWGVEIEAMATHLARCPVDTSHWRFELRAEELSPLPSMPLPGAPPAGASPWAPILQRRTS